MPFRRPDNSMLIGKPLDADESYVLRFINKKVFADHEDFIIITTGKRGKGKSYANLRLAETWSALHGIPFNVKDNVKYTVKSFLSAVNSGAYEEGSCIIMEEVGVQVNNRNFMSDINKSLNFVVQTVRTRHYVIMVNLPLSKLTDLSVRNLASARLEMVYKVPKRNVSVGKFKLLDYSENIKSNKMRETAKFLRFKIVHDPRNYKISLVEFELPSPQIIADYEEKKKAYTAQLYADLEKSIVDQEFGEIEGSTPEPGMLSVVEEKGDVVNKVLLKNLLALRNDYGLGVKNMKMVTGYKMKMINRLLKYAKEQGMVVRQGNIGIDEFESSGGVLNYRRVWDGLQRPTKKELGELEDSTSG